MNTITPYSKLSDNRGCFIGLLSGHKLEEVNIVETKKGFSRGKHYHKNTQEIIFMLSGKAEVTLYHICQPNKVSTLILNEMEGILIEPFTLHEFFYLEDSKHIAFLSNAFDPQKPDLHLL